MQELKRMLREELKAIKESIAELTQGLASLQPEQLNCVITDAKHGIEFKPVAKQSGNNPMIMGQVMVRMYNYRDSSEKAMTFFLAPMEAHKASVFIDAVLRSPHRRQITHDFKGTVTGLSIETTDNKVYRLALTRQAPQGSPQQMTVEAKAEELSFLASFLRSVAVRQSFSRPVAAAQAAMPVHAPQKENPFEARRQGR